MGGMMAPGGRIGRLAGMDAARRQPWGCVRSFRRRQRRLEEAAISARVPVRCLVGRGPCCA